MRHPYGHLSISRGSSADVRPRTRIRTAARRQPHVHFIGSCCYIPQMDEQNLVFLSYASPDRDRILEFHDYLAHHGFDVWMDVRRLKGGQSWDFEIKRAMEKSAIIVVFLSKNSVDRRGYAQREIKIALDQARDRFVDDIYLVPVMLDDVGIPEQLAKIQVIRDEDSDSKSALIDAINHQFDRLGVETARLQGETEVRWTKTHYKDTWDGLPGYETSYQLLKFSSDEYPHAHEITEVIRGWLAACAMNEREVKFSQSGAFHNFGKSRWSRQNTWEAVCGDPKIKGRILSVTYNVFWYGAGAAHPNHGFKTFCFTLDPITQISSIKDVFNRHDETFAIIQEEARSQLLGKRADDASNDDEPLLDEKWVHGGTESWDDFSTFAFAEDGIEFFFSPYHVGPYAMGSHSIVIPYAMVAKQLRRRFACALDVDHLQNDWHPLAGSEDGIGDDKDVA